ncbi:hypothetical protein D3C75_550980 [compost metagenome]
MRPDVSAIQQHILVCTGLERCFHLLFQEGSRTRIHCKMVGSLQIMKRHVIINPVWPQVMRFRERRHTLIQITVPARDHFAISVIRPYLDDIIRKFNISAFIQFGNFSVQSYAAHRILDGVSDHIILFPDHLRDHCAAFLGRVEVGVQFPERLISLSSEGKYPDDLLIFLLLNRLCP